MTSQSEPVVDLVARPAFSQLIRDRSWSAHQNAETTGFMQALLDGRLPVESYGEMVAQLSLVYDTLAIAGDALRNDPAAGHFVFAELDRRNAFAADLDFLLGADRAPIEPLPATARYLERLREVCFTWPGAYIAHHYTRFMGDLSGGQMIRVALARAYGFEHDDGLRSLTFERVADRNAFKAEYRRRLDALPWDVSEQDRVIDEILLAYRGNTEIIGDLGVRYRAAIEA